MFFKPSIIGLMEIKIDKIRLDIIRCKLGFKHGFVVDRVGIGGGLALWWKEEVDIHIRSYSKFHIDAWIGNQISSRITLFYGSPYTQLRHRSWDLLATLADMSDQPWLVFGDFNEVFFSWK